MDLSVLTSRVNASVFVPMLDIVFPPVCRVCDRLFHEPDERRVCDECWSQLKPVNPGVQTWQERADAFSANGWVDDFMACYLFEKEGVFQRLVHLIKYDGMKTLAVRLGRDIGIRIRQHSRMSGAGFVIPVPLHRVKERERGFNQSAYLSKGISLVTGQKVEPGLLQRKRYTSSQTRLTIDERKANVNDAFHTRPVKGKSIILVDDVMTTGATIEACARVLKQSGASEVFAAAAALAR